MNETQFTQLLRFGPRPVSVQNLRDRTPRTLLLGQTRDQARWHVYLDADGSIHQVLFNQDYMLSHRAQFDTNSDYLLEGELDPALCDHDFSQLLLNAGVSLNFAKFRDTLPSPRRTGYFPYLERIFTDLSQFETECLTGGLLGADASDSLALDLLVEAAQSIDPLHQQNASGVVVQKALAPCVTVRAMALLEEAKKPALIAPTTSSPLPILDPSSILPGAVTSPPPGFKELRDFLSRKAVLSYSAQSYADAA